MQCEQAPPPPPLGRRPGAPAAPSRSRSAAASTAAAACGSAARLQQVDRGRRSKGQASHDHRRSRSCLRAAIELTDITQPAISPIWIARNASTSACRSRCSAATRSAILRCCPARCSVWARLDRRNLIETARNERTSRSRPGCTAPAPPQTRPPPPSKLTHRQGSQPGSQASSTGALPAPLQPAPKLECSDAGARLAPPLRRPCMPAGQPAADLGRISTAACAQACAARRRRRSPPHPPPPPLAAPLAALQRPGGARQPVQRGAMAVEGEHQGSTPMFGIFVLR